MCNLSVFRLVRGKFPELFAHAQTVDTRPLFPPRLRGLGTRLTLALLKLRVAICKQANTAPYLGGVHGISLGHYYRKRLYAARVH